MSDEQLEYQKTHTPTFIKINVIGNINFPRQEVEELWIKTIDGIWVIDSKYYFKPHKDEFNDFLRLAQYIEVEQDNNPDNVESKLIINDESKNAFAYYMKGEWTSINGEIDEHQMAIDNLRLLL